MEDILWLTILATPAQPATAVTVKGPDGYALLGILIVIVIPVLIYFFVNWLRNKGTRKSKASSLFHKSRYTVTLEKNKVYFPDFLTLRVNNTGNTDIDLDRPLLVFHNFWLKRKFKLKGTTGYNFYPLLLEPGKSHELTIDLGHFYRHDSALKRFSRVTVTIKQVNSKSTVSQQVMLRKTLFR